MSPNINMKNQKPGSGLLYLIIIALITAGIFIILNPGENNTEKITLNEFVEETESGEVAKIEVEDNRINITLIDDSKQYAFKEPGTNRKRTA